MDGLGAPPLDDPVLGVPPVNQTGIGVLVNLGITGNQVTDSQLFTGLWFNAVLGAVCFVAFCFLQRSAFPRHYRHRLVSPSVTVKPRNLPTKGWASLWQWLVNAIVTPEKEILSSAGLDAVVMTWSLKIGISLFLPMAIVGCTVLIPLHYTAYGKNTKLQEDTQGNNGKLMRLTIASLPNGSQMFWIHFGLAVLYNIYAMCILFWHFRRYVIIRQTYLTRGDDPNYWMALTHQADAKSISRKVRRMLQDLNLESASRQLPGHTSLPGSAGDDGAALLGNRQPVNVMSSLRGLGAGISKFFGSRAPSVTPPPSEPMTLAENSLVGPPPPLGTSTGGGMGSAGASCGGGGPGGGTSGGGASSAGASMPQSPMASVLGVSPAALATRMRLMRSAIGLGPQQQQQQQQQPPDPLIIPPSSQEMPTAHANPGAADVQTLGTAAPLGGGPGAAATLPSPPPAPASTPHHHHRVAHMRTITEENLDALLRHGSSGGVDLLAMGPPPGGVPGSPEAAARAAAAAVTAAAATARKRAELLGSTAEATDGEEEEGVTSEATVDAAGPAATSAPAPPLMVTSPFAVCGSIAGSIAQQGVGAAAAVAAEAAAAAAARNPISLADGGRAANVSELPLPGVSGSSGELSQPRISGNGRGFGSSSSGWATALSPGHYAVGPAGGAQVGAGDVGARYPGATGPDDLRLVLRSPRRVSSASISDGGRRGSDPAAPPTARLSDSAGAQQWPAAPPDMVTTVDAPVTGGEAARRVAYHWWKALPEDSLQTADSISASDLDGYEGWREQPLLAKPSVRFRKTINADNPAYKPYGPMRNPSERAKVAVNAQHYAILVTDVTQWPYPELQREYDARYKPSVTERLMQWLGRVPRAVSRPGATLFGLRADGDSDIGSVSGDGPPRCPLAGAGTRRSLEMPRGQSAPGAAADDLEAAVETIENAKAKLQLLTIASSDDNTVIERASRTLKAIERAERQVSRLAEARERTVAISRDHSQMQLALSRTAHNPSTVSVGSSGHGSIGGGGSAGGAAPRASSGSFGPSCAASVRTVKTSDPSAIGRMDSSVAGAAVGAGGPAWDAALADYAAGRTSFPNAPGSGAGAAPGLGRLPAGTAALRASNEGRSPKPLCGSAEAELGSSREYLPFAAHELPAGGGATPWRNSSGGGGPAPAPYISSGGASTGSVCGTSGGGGLPPIGASSRGAFVGGSSGGGGAPPPAPLPQPPQRIGGCSPPAHLRLAVPPEGGSPPLHHSTSPHTGVANVRHSTARISASGLRAGSSGGGMAPHESRRPRPELRGVSLSSLVLSSGGDRQPASLSLGGATAPVPARASAPGTPVGLRRGGAFGSTLDITAVTAGLEGRSSDGEGQRASASAGSAAAASISVVATVSAGDETAEDAVLVPINSARSEEAGTVPPAQASAGGPGSAPRPVLSVDRRASFGSLPPIEPATSPVLKHRGVTAGWGLATRLRGILWSSGDRGARGGSDDRQQRGAGRSGGARHRQRQAARVQAEAASMEKKRQRAAQEEAEREGLIPAGLTASDSSKALGGMRTARDARARWALVRRALESGRLLRMPYDANNYSIVTSTFKRLFPRDFDAAIPVINHREVDQLLMQWESAVAELERAELTRTRTGREPKSCSLLPCRRVETIPQLQQEILRLEQKIEEARRRAWATKFTPSWFVLFKSQQAAAMAASTQIYGEDTSKFQVHPAPGPEEVNWQHLWLTWRQRDLRALLTWPLLVAVVVFPITLVTSAAAQLQYVLCPLQKHGAPATASTAYIWPWYCQGHSMVANFMRSLITGWLPALLLNLWLVMVLPRLVYLLVQSEGSSFSLSALERRVGVVFFYWDVFNVFLQGVVGSTFFQRVQQIIFHPQTLPGILGAALPTSSNFFIQFISMRALFLVWLRMCVPHGGVWQNWVHQVCCPPPCFSMCHTERDKSLTYGPRTPRYGFEMGHVLLIYLLALTFSVVAPLLLPFSVIWFVFAWVQWRHNLCYVYARKYESGGLMWTYMFSRICICLVIMQLFTFCVLAFKGAFMQAFLIVAFMPALTMKFHRNCERRFGRGVENVPLELASRAPRGRVPPLVYIPPPLQEKSWGWYPEWNKIWDGWGMPTGYAVRF